MLRSRILLFALVGVLAFYGCQEEIDLDLPDNEPELVVEAYLTGLDFYIPEGDLDCSGVVTIPRAIIQAAADTLSTFDLDSIERITNYFPFNKVQLTTTANYFSNAGAPAVSGASVKLFEDGILVETLVEDASIAGTYRFTYAPQINKSYHLEIEALGNFYETDKELYQEVPPLFEANANYLPNFLGDSCEYYLGINTFEKPGPGDHYRWMFYRNNVYISNPGNISTANDDGIDGLCLFDFDVFGNDLQLGDTMIVFQLRTSEAYFNFINSLRNQTAFVGGPFDTPPAPITGNINNVSTGEKAFGFFAACAGAANGFVVPDTIPAGGCP